MIAAQLHPSALILVLASLALWIRGRLRLRWGWMAGGVAVGSLTLVPWLAWWVEQEGLARMGDGEGFLGRGIVLVFPVLKGLLYWLRDPSMFLPRRAMALDFAGAEGASGAALEVLVAMVVGALGVAGVGFALVANARLWRRPWRPVGASLCVAVLTAFGSPHFRCGGRQGLQLALRHDAPMLRELGVQATCPLPVDVPDAWWPDVLPVTGEAADARSGPSPPNGGEARGEVPGAGQ